MSRRGRRRGLVACLVAAMLAAAEHAGAASSAVKLHYTAELLGIDALEFSVAVQEVNDRYRIQVAGMTEGMVDWLVGWRSFTTVDGALRGTETRPEDYHAINLFRGRRSIVSMRYTPDGSVEATADPPPGDDRDPVSEEQRRSSVDTLTAGLVLGRLLASGQPCTGRIPIFDGRRRYDLVMEDGGQAPVKLPKALPAVGAGHACWFRIHRIAGFKKKGQTFDKPEYHDRRYRILSASIVDGFPPLALDVTGEFSLGSFHVHLVRMERGEAEQLFLREPPFDTSMFRPGESIRPSASQPSR